MQPTIHIRQMAVGAALTAAFMIALSGAVPHQVISAPPNPPSDTACNNGRVVQVSGAATINVTPDRVLVKLGVDTNGASPEEVQTRNNAATQNVIKAARGLGIAAKDISTDHYLVQPIYDSYDSLIIKGYRIYNTIGIVLKDAGKTSEVMVAAFKAGANKVEDVQFYTSQLRRYRDEARALAMKAAQEKAQALAIVGGAQLGCVMSINEQSWSYYSGSWWSGRDQALASQNVIQNAAVDAAPGPEDAPISLGQIAVKAEVQASFSLE